MPGSVSSIPPNPPILSYVLAVGGLVCSLMLTAFGFSNNAWIVVDRPSQNDEFQRGIRGHDCYKLNSEPAGKNIKCLPWEFKDKSVKFPEPFNQVFDASFVVHTAGYFAIVIILSQIFWLIYTIGHCCSQKFSERAEKFKLILFHVMVTSVGLWMILFFGIIYAVFGDKILPYPSGNQEYEYQIGTGCWLFFLGGMLPFMVSLYCLFGEQVEQSKTRLQAIIRRHRPIPTNEEEMSDRP